ncbi:MAG: cytochrome c family protein [Gammaproteobacteria bacterium]|nr:cytochrome c family protein [Gammaproteobacteria bacterium]
MHTISRLLTATLTFGLLLTACAEGGGGGARQAAAVAGNAAAPAQDLPALLGNADLDKGRVLFLQCRACHGLEQGGVNKVGPNLYGIFGQKAGSVPGFAYSEALAGADIVWSAEALDDWLARPSDFLPGNRMVFAGIRKPEDRANLIAYLKQETGYVPPQ